MTLPALFPINTVIPGANNKPGNDQGPMQVNYANISGIISVDHIPPGSSGNGRHNQSTYLSIGVVGTLGLIYPTIDPGYCAIFSATPALAGSIPQAYFEDQNSITYQMTGPSSALANGYTALFNGLIIQWGFSPGGSDPQPVSFPIKFPAAAFSVTVTPVNTNTNITSLIVAGSVSQTGFTYRTNTPSKSAAYWMAIGN
jgi:hypothetical protein